MRVPVLAVLTALSMLTPPAPAQLPAVAPSGAGVLEPPGPLATGPLLRRDTPVRLMVMREVTTKTAHVGDRFPLHVDEPILVEGTVVVPAGTPAWGEVLSASESGAIGKSGKMTTRLLYIDLPTRRIDLRGEEKSAGTPGAGATVYATVSLALLGAGPLGLLTRGTNAKLKAGEIVTGYVATDQVFGGPRQ